MAGIELLRATEPCTSIYIYLHSLTPRSSEFPRIPGCICIDTGIAIKQGKSRVKTGQKGHAVNAEAWFQAGHSARGHM